MTMKLTSTKTVIDNYNGWKGEQLVKELGGMYERGQSIVTIAKKVRKIIKAAIRADLLPKMKVSVTVEKYSMGQSLNIAVKDLDINILNVAAWRSHNTKSWLGGRYNAAGTEILDFLTQVAKAFQLSESHSNTDYHNTNFYEHVGFAGDLEDRQRSTFVEDMRE